MRLIVQFYPSGGDGYVREYLERLRLDSQHRKAHNKLKYDLAVLGMDGLMSRFLDIKRVTGISGSVWELRRLYQGIAYRIYFCVSKGEVWLLHYLEKDTAKIPKSDLEIVRKRSRDIFAKKRSRRLS
ncbi:type II toxin-antitoxin system RelE/ParE family toxin [Elusimicrobiota bacterium]